MISQSTLEFIKRVTNLRYLLNILLFSYVNEYGNISYSQEGEDRILNSIFGGKPKGFYIDIGAHHPQRFSNTNLFYNMGWHGINIDASKEAIQLFKTYRKRDVNLCIGVGLKSEKKEYIMFDEPAVNTFVVASAKDKLQNTKFKVINKRMVKIEPLSKILNKYLKKKVQIDFLTIDVEGLDYQVLKSNDWNKYRPKYIVAEVYGSHDFLSISENKITNYLKKVGYSPIAKTLNSVIFKMTHE